MADKPVNPDAAESSPVEEAELSDDTYVTSGLVWLIDGREVPFETWQGSRGASGDIVTQGDIAENKDLSTELLWL